MATNKKTIADLTEMELLQFHTRVRNAIIRLGTKGWVKGSDRVDTEKINDTPACLRGALIADLEYTLHMQGSSLPYGSPFQLAIGKAYSQLLDDVHQVVGWFLLETGRVEHKPYYDNHPP